MNICNYCEHEKTCTNKPLATTRCKDYKEMSEELKPQQSAELIKVGFDSCYNQMKKKLAEKDKEIARLKNRVEKLESFLFKIQEISIPHIGSLVFFQAEIRAINRWCKVALGKDTDVSANDTDNNVGSMEV